MMGLWVGKNSCHMYEWGFPVWAEGRVRIFRSRGWPHYPAPRAVGPRAGYWGHPEGRKILTRPTAHTGTSFLYGWTLGKIGQKLTCKTLHGPVKILHGPAKSKPIFKWNKSETEVVYINYDAKQPKTDRYPKNSVPENWNWDRSSTIKVGAHI